MNPVRGPCVANKMSWASKRSTSRIVDTAYCLLGLFGVNLPLLYGEGMRAFTRLQEEIVRVSDDHSIFVFEASSDERPVLAPSPAAFVNGARIKCLDGSQYAPSEPCAITKDGLRIRLPLVANKGNVAHHAGILACKYKDDLRGPIGITLVRAHEGTEEMYFPLFPFDQMSVVELGDPGLPAPREIYIRDGSLPSAWDGLSDIFTCFIQPDKRLKILKLYPSQAWNKQGRTLSIWSSWSVHMHRWVAAAELTLTSSHPAASPEESSSFLLLFGTTRLGRHDFSQRWITAVSNNASYVLENLTPVDAIDLGQAAPATEEATLRLGEEVILASIKRKRILGEFAYVVDVTVIAPRLAELHGFGQDTPDQQEQFETNIVRLLLDKQGVSSETVRKLHVR